MPIDYSRIEKAIHYVEEHFQEQPRLKELAAYLNMSPYHFGRLFRSWAGISPKRFLQFVTLSYAKKLLTENRSILDVSYESGLSGPSRLHDLFVNIEAVTPGEFKLKGSGLHIDYGAHLTPFGTCLLATTIKGVCHLAFITATGLENALIELMNRWQNAKIQENPQKTETLIGKIFGLQPQNVKNSISLYLKGTNFQIKVWEALLRIPSGYVCTYKDIARYVGHPAAIRAVGNAVAVNPVGYIIPCHRVIRKTGAFGNYHFGTVRKKALIGWEIAQRHR